MKYLIFEQITGPKDQVKVNFEEPMKKISLKVENGEAVTRKCS